MNTKRNAFTIIELLVVISILALLVAILVPTLARAKELAKSALCLMNLKGTGQGLVMYETGNDGCVVPSYNMPRPGTYAGAAGDVVDGWAAILERDGLVPSSKGPTDNIFYCPNTLDIDGMNAGQTGYDQDKPSGYQDWPIQWVTAGGDSAQKCDPTLPIPGFGDSHGLYIHQIRCGYFFNSYNPIGTAPPAGLMVPDCAYYSQCVGFGPFANGNLGLVRRELPRPASLIVACDGMYMGRQSVTRLGEQNRRIGYRHPGERVTADVNGTSVVFTNTVSNAVFADGHAVPIPNDQFPHSNVSDENKGKYSLLAYP